MSIKYEKRENQMKQQTSFSENVYDDRWHWSKTIIIYLKNKNILKISWITYLYWKGNMRNTYKCKLSDWEGKVNVQVQYTCTYMVMVRPYVMEDNTWFKKDSGLNSETTLQEQIIDLVWTIRRNLKCDYNSGTVFSSDRLQIEILYMTIKNTTRSGSKACMKSINMYILSQRTAIFRRTFCSIMQFS